MRTKRFFDPEYQVVKNQSKWVGDEADGEEFPVPSAIENTEPHSTWVGDEAVRWSSRTPAGKMY